MKNQNLTQANQRIWNLNNEVLALRDINNAQNEKINSLTSELRRHKEQMRQEVISLSHQINAIQRHVNIILQGIKDEQS